MFNLKFLIFAGFLFYSDINCQNVTCGKQLYPPHSHQGTSRIVGGTESVPHSWPWMVILRYRTSPITCAGTLITGANGEIVVLTAAQCIDGSPSPSDWYFDVGVHSRTAMEPNRKTYQVKEHIKHPLYDILSKGDDIAILKATENITANDYVQPICLTPVDSGSLVGKECVVTGWGSDVLGGPPLDRLHEIYKPIVDDVDCNNALGIYGYNTTSMLCAGKLAQGGVDSCSYDSGAPLACRTATGDWEVVGISSWGYGCAMPGYPSVYTEVHYFLSWINTQTQ